MAHLPVNHALLPLYRVIAGLVGAYILAFGLLGTVETWGDPLFDRSNIWVLGLRTNLAFSLLSVLVGAVILIGAVRGGNADHFINLYGGGVFLVAGMAMMALLQTEANFLNFSMTTVVVSFLIGMALICAGLYGKVGPPEAADAEEEFRHRGGVAPPQSPSREAPAGARAD